MGSRAVKSVAFVTVGCKLNQFETEQMREVADGAGYVSTAATGKADIYVINTCTVTSKSDYRSRQAVRRALRLNPAATVIVTGCYAQLGAQQLAEIDGVDVIAGNAEKGQIRRYLGMSKQPEPVIEITESSRATRLSSTQRLHAFGNYTRAFVKIQDGCDNRCTYCAVPLARGRSRSKPVADITAEIALLAERGYREIVLTGVHLGSYGRDLSPPTSLAKLLEAIPPTGGLERVRLSSVEPTDFTEELIDMMAGPRAGICPHVHVPLQSGDDHILKSMGRHYSAGFYADVIGRIADRVPCCGIGADVMVGFPGEDDRAFRNTYDLIATLPLTYLHVFAFSGRYHTPAAGMRPQVDPQAKKQRSKVLRQLGRDKSYGFRNSLVGSDLDVLVLKSLKDGKSTGLSGNYVSVLIETRAEPNTIAACRITGLQGQGVRGKVCGTERPVDDG
jgi:threonylcarbamoyladenosine tRNA methylthiotransferase MtaB